MIRINLGGEGEVPDAINVQPSEIGGRSDLARSHAQNVAVISGQSVVRAAGNRLPFATQSVDEVVTNNVPIDVPQIGYYGPSFTTVEIQRILKLGGSWWGSSAP
jgi:hypothetical protein